VRGAIRAYDETGIRATVCIGYADQGSIVYPPSDSTAFLATLTPETRQYLERPSRPAYMPSVEATIDLMHRLLGEYADHPRIRLAYGPAGPQWVSDDAWRALSRDAAAKNVGLHFHLLESPAQSESMQRLYPGGVLAHLETLGVFEAKASCAHFAQASAADIADAKRLGLIVVTNPGSNMRLFNGVPPLRDMKNAGLTIALGTDNCALTDDEDYLRELRLGALLARAPGTDGRSDASSVLKMATRAGAKAAFLENVGDLRAGAQADLVAVSLERIRGAWLDPDMDILDALLSRGCGQDVVLTMVAGRVLYQHGAFPLVDLAKAREEAAATASAVRSAGVKAASAASELRSALRSHYSGVGQ
jgi:5-methylthioadenosine/S-adenosylhomocysteine deaminase